MLPDRYRIIRIQLIGGYVPDQKKEFKYPLLEQMLEVMGMPLKATYTMKAFAELFGVTVRSAQTYVASGRLPARDLPGRARFFPSDIEQYLRDSERKPKR